MKKLKFSVVTPCYNAIGYLPQTVQSVLAQSALLEGRCELQYIIVDGGSRDGTKEYLEALAHPDITWISEPDKGMYDALSKGFVKADGEIFCYINAGDAYFPWAFEVAAEVFRDESINWITGLSTLINERGHVFQVARARRYWSSLIQRGAYGKYLPFIQQESTFWRQRLWSSVDKDSLRKMKLAGDYYIWVCFALKNKLYAVDSMLAAFRIHSGQLSENKREYFSELNGVCSSGLSVVDRAGAWMDKLLAYFPAGLLRRVGYDNSIRFNQENQRWQK